MNKLERESLVADIGFGMILSDSIRSCNALRHKQITDWSVCRDGIRLVIGGETVLLQIKIEE